MARELDVVIFGATGERPAQLTARNTRRLALPHRLQHPPAAAEKTSPVRQLLIRPPPGFTGARVAAEVLPQAAAAGLRAGLAGRDESKLRALAATIPGGDAAAVLAGIDVNDGASMARLAGSCRLLLNCVGPYRCAGGLQLPAAAASRPALRCLHSLAPRTRSHAKTN